MIDHFDLSDDDFVRQFETAEMNPKLFTHEAHLRLAWLYIMRYGFATAIEKIEVDIKRFTAAHGAFDKFNKTLTIAATKAVYHFMMKSKSNHFKDFIKEFPRLKFSFRALMDAHYGFDIYQSENAKKAYLAPDLLPFD